VKATKLTILAGIVVIIVLISGLVTILQQRHELRENQLRIDSLQSHTKQLEVELGRNIFHQNCRMCHAAKGMTDNLLEGIVDRLGENYLKLYLTKQDSLLKANDKYALQLKNEFGKQANSHNFTFTRGEFEALVEYLK
jgi:hypothetical protein